MKKTVLITGASSGIGRASAKYFAERGWNVAATMRRPDSEAELSDFQNVSLFPLDVTDPASIKAAVSSALEKCGTIDVVVNNAGYGALGVFEAATTEQIKRQFETNVFGVMNVIREILPHFRFQRKGIIINVTSMVGLISFPMFSVYSATKFALEGFAESLSFELRQFNIKIKNVEPGAIKTDFYGRSQEVFSKAGLNDYDRYQKVTMTFTQKAGENAPGPEVVARTIFKAANDDSYKLRYPAGIQSSLFLVIRRLLPNRLFFLLVRKVMEKGL